MADLIVNGGKPLNGIITPSGNKNEALPVLAATLLAEGPVVLDNLPDILQVPGIDAVYVGPADLSLTAEECLYMLCWTQRLLLKKSQGPGELAEDDKASLKANIVEAGAMTKGGAQEVHNVRVFRIAGQNALEASLPGQRRAEAVSGDVDALLQGISEERRARLFDKKKGKKGVPVKVTVEKMGSRWKIVGLDDPS